MNTSLLNGACTLSLLTCMFGLNTHPLIVSAATVAIWLAVQLALILRARA